jgi:nitroreductase
LNTFDAIKTRRAIKKFDPSHNMTIDEIKFLMELVILSPTSYNQQNWRFITVTDQKIKEQISIAARNQPQPSDGSLVIILCGNTNAWQEDPNRYWKNSPKERQELVTNALKKKVC